MTTTGDAYTRVARILYLSLGLGGTAFALLDVAPAREQFPVLNPIWGLSAFGLLAGLPAVIGILARFAPLRLLHRLAIAEGAVFVAVLMTWLPMMTGPLPGNGTPWTNMLVTVAAAGVSMAVRPGFSWAYAVLVSVLGGLLRYTASPAVGVTVAVLDGSYILLMNAIFVALILSTRSAAARLDAAAERARDAAASHAAAEARGQQRARIDALIHDHVLSLLLMASREGSPRAVIRSLAHSTGAALRNAAPAPGETVTMSEFVARLRSAITALDSEVPFEARLTDVAAASSPTPFTARAEPTVLGDGGVPRRAAARSAGQSSGADEPVLPVSAADALVEAATEALRNSLRHAAGDAAQPVARSVQVSTGRGAVTVRVSDNGRGFALRRVAPERLGVRVSILGRMTALRGGTADIHSARSADAAADTATGTAVGTVVTLTWHGEEGTA